MALSGSSISDVAEEPGAGTWDWQGGDQGVGAGREFQQGWVMELGIEARGVWFSAEVLQEPPGAEK